MNGSGAGAADRVARQLRRIRWRLRRLSAVRRYGPAALESAPILFGNSFPKSGTHLLAQALQAFPEIGLAVDVGMGPILTFDRFSGRRRTPQEILSDLQGLQRGDLGFGHIAADELTVQHWCRQSVVHYLMFRDPRDVVVSHAFYIADKATQNVHHEFYKSLPTLDDRIRASIQGRPEWAGDFPDIQARYGLYRGWLDCEWVVPLKFEDFVADQPSAVAGMLDCAVDRGFRLHVEREAALETLLKAIAPEGSFTFRRGQTGDWRHHFSPAHKQLFKDTAGDLLIQLGYEESLDW